MQRSSNVISYKEHKEWLEKIIAGWKSRSAMTTGGMSDKGNADTNNRLDFCWLVVDPLRFAQDPNWYDYYQGLSEVATVRGIFRICNFRVTFHIA